MNLRPPLSLLAILTAAAGLMVSPNQARASVTLSFEQVGDDVVASYSGSWSSWNSGPAFGDTGATFDSNEFSVYDGLVGVWYTETPIQKPANWTNKDNVTVGSYSGDSFGFKFDTSGTLYAPSGYTAGNSFSGSMTLSDETFSTLGFTEGTGSITTGGGTINYTVGAIPEPSSYGFLLGAVGLATAVFCRRPRARTD